MTDNPRLTIRKWAQLAFGVTIILYGIIGFPALDGLEPEPAAAQIPCRYGGTPGNCRPRPSCTHGGAWPSCAPPPVCTVQAWEGCGPGGKPRPPTCTYGGSYPHCYPNPASGRTCTYGGTYPHCNEAPHTVEVKPPTTCNSVTHGENCKILLDLGVDPDTLDGDSGDSITVEEGRRIAEEACRLNPLCDSKAMSDAWDALLSDPLFDPDGINRGEQASVQCEAYGDGNVPCNPQTDGETIQLVQWMCGQGYTTGYTENCGAITTIEQAEEEFGQSDEMTQGQAWSFNARPLQSVGYLPPVSFDRTGSQTSNSHCINGLTLIQAHVSDTDKGCRPPQCDFGRGDDGWCLQPDNTDQHIIYIDGEDVDEDAGTATFRVALSHVSDQTIVVTVITSDGTANSGSDYGTVNRRVTFRRGQTAARVSVRIINDTRSEPDETFMLSMSNPSSNTELSDIHQSETTIRDDDEPPFLGAVTNLNAACVSGEITLSWGRPSLGTVRDYRYGIYEDEFLVRRVTGGTTTDTQVTVAVDDTTKTYYAEIQARGGRNFNQASWLETDGFVCTVPPPVVSLADTSLSVDEGSSGQITATLDTASDGTAVVWFSPSGGIGGAIPCFTGADFSVSSPSFVFDDTNTASVTFTACEDADIDDEIITLALTTTDINGLELGSPTTIVVSITDDDTIPNVSLDAITLSVDEVMSVTISASLDAMPSGTASVRFTTSRATDGSGSCSAGADFYVSDTEFIFTARTSASITLYACDDADTTDETVRLTLTTTDIAGLQLGSPTTMRITITDDDGSAEFLR